MRRYLDMGIELVFAPPPPPGHTWLVVEESVKDDEVVYLGDVVFETVVTAQEVGELRGRPVDGQVHRFHTLLLSTEM